MAAPFEVILSSEASGQLWNTCVWDPHSGTSIVTYKGGSAGPRTLCLLANDYLVTALNNKPLIHVWALQKKEQSQLRSVCPGKVSVLACTPDGFYCAGAIAEKIHVWQVCTGHLLCVISRHYQQVTCLQFTDDGSHLVSAADDNMVLVWPMSSVLSERYSSSQSGSGGVEPRHTWSKHSLPVTDLHVGRGGVRARVATASLDQTVKLWELASGQLLCSIVFETSIKAVAMDSAEHRLYAGGANGHIYQVNLFQQPLQRELHVAEAESSEDSMIFKGHSKQVTCLSVSMDGLQLVSGSHDTTVKLWDVASRQCVRTLSHKGAVTNAIITATPSRLMGGDVKTALPIQAFKRHLHQPGGDGHRETVDIRIDKSQAQEATSIGLPQRFMDELQNESESSPDAGQTQAELEKEVERLKQINKQVYDFAVTEILHQTGS